MVKNFKMDDPFELKAVEISNGNIELQVRIMAEEFRDIGASRQEIMRMFGDSFYAGMYLAYIQLGKAAVEKIVNKTCGNIRVIKRQEP